MHEGHDHDAANGAEDAMAKMKKGLANLSESDRASAMKQHMCPVSGEMLGVMGEPIKVTVNDQEVWICCSDCEKDLLANPDEYLKKVSSSGSSTR
jgi:Cu(I)/Ag(I) efflux system membrane fusion protein